jgi:hypothetical protein
MPGFGRNQDIFSLWKLRCRDDAVIPLSARGMQDVFSFGPSLQDEAAAMVAIVLASGS